LAADLVWTPGTGWPGRRWRPFRTGRHRGPQRPRHDEQGPRSRRKNSVGSALSSCNKVAKRYPDSVYAPEALYRAARLHLTRKEYFKAFEAYQGVVGRYPNSKRFGEIIGEQYRIASALLDGAR